MCYSIHRRVWQIMLAPLVVGVYMYILYIYNNNNIHNMNHRGGHRYRKVYSKKQRKYAIPFVENVSKNNIMMFLKMTKATNYEQCVMWQHFSTKS